MKEEDPHLTIVFIGSMGSCVFGRHDGAWHFESGLKLSFEQLVPKEAKPKDKIKNPGPCRDVLGKFLEAKDHFLGFPRYDHDGNTVLREIRCDLKKAFKKIFEMIGCNGIDPIASKRGEGYKLLSAYVAKAPDWLSSESFRKGEMSGARFRRASLGLPRLLWAEALVGLVSEGRSLYVGVLPGNGLEQVHSILRESVNNSQIIKVDLALLDNKDQLLKEIASQADGAEVSVIETSRLDSLLPLARAVRGVRDQLGIVVNGLGVFAGRASLEALKGVAKVLHGLSKVDSDHVALVVPSPTEPHHFLPYNKVGSFLTDLAPVFLRPSDSDAIQKWALERFENTASNELDDLLKHAAGQLGALQAAMLDSQGTHEDRLTAIRHAHQKAGLQILNAVGPCCRRVLIGESRNHECRTALKDAHILDESNRASIAGWTTSWHRARRRR